MKRFLVILFILSGVNAYSQKIHSPSEILRLMIGSATKYHMEIIDYKIKCPDYSSKLNVNNCFRVDADENVNVYEYKIKEKAEEYFNIGERLFVSEKFDSAIVYYSKAYDEDSSVYNALTYMGQCYSLLKKYDEAESILKKVIGLNYIDYMAHWFLADVYAAKGKWKEAAKEITVSNVLNRNNPRILKSLADIYKKAKLEWHSYTFNPQIKLVDLGGTDSVKIYSNKTWLMYANTKAVWAFEYQYRESMGETKKPEFSTTEEVESLAVLYSFLKNTDEDFDDVPELVALDKAINKKMLYPYIFYEIMLPQYPSAAYSLPRETLDKIVDYVLNVRTWKEK